MRAPFLLHRLRMGWPLLGKELLEQASRRQTYVLRVAYAVVLFAGFCFYYFQNLHEGSVQALGRGLGPFRFLITAQLATIYVLLPPLMAGAIAQEKERDTLGLLFLTDLTPWELILQKYIGRLIPMLTLLFLSLPLLAVAYSLGGVSFTLLCSSAVMLFSTCLAVGALALECSAYAATTFQALLRCWGLCAALVLCCSILPPFSFLARGSSFLFPNPSALSTPTFFGMVFFGTVSCLLPTFLFLARAKHILESRAFVERRNPFGHQFKRLDHYWQDVGKLVRAMSRSRDPEARALAEQVMRRPQDFVPVGHLSLFRASSLVPPAVGVPPLDEHPSFGRFLFTRMQVPNLLAFSIILASIVLIFLFFATLMDSQSAGFFTVICGCWVLVLLTVPILGANVVARERINQRLDVLLTTPLAGSEILHQWLAPVRRWIRFLARPLGVLILLEALINYWTLGLANSRWINLACFLGLSLSAVYLYPRLLQWSCLWIGLRIRNQIRALLASFFAAASWCFLPVLVSRYLQQTALLSSGETEVLKFLSPVTVLQTAEALTKSQNASGVPVEVVAIAIVHLALTGLLTWKIRQSCLNNADRYLERV